MTSVHERMIDAASSHFLSNLLPEAEAICRDVLEEAPDHPKALHLLGLIYYQLNRSEEALGLFERALATDASDPACHNSRGSVLYQLGRADEAVAAFRLAVALAPTSAEAHINLGNALFAARRLTEAEATLRRALVLEPNHATACNNLATTVRDLGRYVEAEQLLRHAITLAPANLEAQYNLADILFNQMRLEEAEVYFRKVVEGAPRFVPGHVGLGQVLYNLDRLAEAIEVLDKARKLAPEHAALEYAWRLACSARIPAWHLPMLRDTPRNDAYDAALRRAVAPDSVVLEIGTGSAVVAMMAARAGARHVYTCEINEELARTAVETVARNGFSDRITVIPKISTRLQIGVDLPERADVLVSELINVGLLAPGMLSTLRHAMTELLVPGAKVIPGAATVYAMLVECDDLATINPLRRVSGFDLSAFDRFRPPGYAQIDLAVEPHRPLTHAFNALDFDFRQDPPDQGGVELEVTAIASGTCHGVAFWFDLALDEQAIYSSASETRNNHWKQAIHFFPRPLAVTVGDTVKLGARYDNTRIFFDLPAVDPDIAGPGR